MGKTHDKSECFKKMIEVIKRNASRDQPLHVNVQYTDNLEDGLQQFEMVKARFECAEAYLTSYDALSCATTGPCTSISFFVDN
jgi:fatty acid-binding protein DegV